MVLNIDVDKINVQSIYDEALPQALSLDVLRLDKIHDVVSGNKWFKLKYYLQYALDNNITSIATFGGAYSNHILATAFACNQLGLKCTGFIRGEKPLHFSDTLKDALRLNMQLVFISRNDYKHKDELMQQHNNLYFISEGGYGVQGRKGAAEILNVVDDADKYDYIVCACGTGTMMAGIITSLQSHQQCIGISVLKNNYQSEDDVKKLLPAQYYSNIKIIHDYSFGGYAKHTSLLIEFMNRIYLRHQLPLDFVYTAKSLYAVYDLAKKDFFPAGSKALFIHSGGLQGNRSLPNQTLINS